MAIKIFGNYVRSLVAGEDYRVVKYTVEGRDCAELVPVEYFCKECGEFLKRIDLGHDDEDYICVNPLCKDRSL